VLRGHVISRYAFHYGHVSDDAWPTVIITHTCKSGLTLICNEHVYIFRSGHTRRPVKWKHRRGRRKVATKNREENFDDETEEVDDEEKNTNE